MFVLCQQGNKGLTAVTNLSRLQVDAQHSDTFAPRCISLPRENYSAMVQALHLPQMAIETSSVVGPFFWSTVDRDDNGITRLRQ